MMMMMMMMMMMIIIMMMMINKYEIAYHAGVPSSSSPAYREMGYGIGQHYHHERTTFMSFVSYRT